MYTCILCELVCNKKGPGYSFCLFVCLFSVRTMIKQLKLPRSKVIFLPLIKSAVSRVCVCTILLSNVIAAAYVRPGTYIYIY